MRTGGQSRRVGRSMSTRTDDGAGLRQMTYVALARRVRGPAARWAAAANPGCPCGGRRPRIRRARTSRVCRDRRSPRGSDRRTCRPGMPRASWRHAPVRTRWPRPAAACAMPRPRWRRATTKQTIDQTGVSSTGARDPGVGEPLVALAWTQADPADQGVALVGDETGRRRVVGEALEDRAVGGRRRVGEAEVADPVERAPAPLRVAAGVEQGREVGDPPAGERQDREVVGWRVRHRGQRTGRAAG